jgi:hypothetical protein
MDVLNFMSLNGWWKKLCPEAVNDCWGFSNQQDKLRNIHLLACKVLREGHFLRRLISRKFLTLMLLTYLRRT